MAAPISQVPGVCIEHQGTAWSGRASMTLVTFRHARFDGSMSDARTWEVLRRGRAAAVLPYDPVTDQVVLVEQFRISAVAAGFDPVMTEIPAGLAEEGETPEETARREAEEETRLRVDRMVPISDILLSAGCSDERIAIFAGRVKAPRAGADGVAGFGGLAGEGEELRVRVVPAGEAVERAIAGAYPNSVTAIALLWLAARRAWLRAEWGA